MKGALILWRMKAKRAKPASLPLWPSWLDFFQSHVLGLGVCGRVSAEPAFPLVKQQKAMLWWQWVSITIFLSEEPHNVRLSFPLGNANTPNYLAIMSCYRITTFTLDQGNTSFSQTNMIEVSEQTSYLTKVVKPPRVILISLVEPTIWQNKFELSQVHGTFFAGS